MFSFFKTRTSAPVARDRLKVLLAHERTFVGNSDLIGLLRGEILAVIQKHVSVEPDMVRIKADRDGKMSTLTIDIEIPMDEPKSVAA